MKLNTPTAILIGSVLIAGVLLFNGSINSTIADYSKKSYEQLSNVSKYTYRIRNFINDHGDIIVDHISNMESDIRQIRMKD